MSTEITTLRRTIFYDELCQLCSREIDLFRKRVPDGSLRFVDISDPGFDATVHGVDPVRVHQEMHVRNEETGELLVGVPALVAMWECVPGFRWLATLTRLPVLRTLAHWGYVVFAWLRPKLPKRARRAACTSGTCATQPYDG
jgi:predicted DCC family thiol-disulfide oxidoreductase YuxK